MTHSTIAETITALQSETRFLACLVWDDPDNRLLKQTDLSPMDFSSPALAHIFEVAQQVQRKGRIVSQLSIAEEDPKTEDGELNVWSVTDGMFHPHLGEFYAEIVAEESQRRKLRDLGPGLTQLADDSSIDTLPAEVHKRVSNAIRMTSVVPRSAADTMQETLAAAENPLTKAPTPWRRMTTALGGFRPGALYTIGARPGVGKSALLLQIAYLLSQRGPVSYHSLEMSTAELDRRLWAQQLQIPSDVVERPRAAWAPFQLDRLDAFLRNGAGRNLYFDDRGGIGIQAVRRQAEAVAGNGPLAGIVVDYVQLLVQKHSEMREQIIEITHALKAMAAEYHCPVIAAAQLNRESTKRPDATPQKSDFAESGSIENDADVVLLLHRPKDGDVLGPDLQVIVDKNRHGPESFFHLNWEGEFVRAWDPTTDHPF